ncbi:hypothetical protein BO71DRAFT_142863 [Aspergillus ellipticus CBS 707.79]|uniref:Uncharacterized protein n=1 Tax=Aspergillus ellipticus CBS 707.79 TaxID=1448320 RepID=A0A319DI81_9EURO|nr:hypothetical protein BO71DRAFT_142863 [Aspergillus ellipticus CBS 707.79]
MPQARGSGFHILRWSNSPEIETPSQTALPKTETFHLFNKQKSDDAFLDDASLDDASLDDVSLDDASLNDADNTYSTEIYISQDRLYSLPEYSPHLKPATGRSLLD